MSLSSGIQGALKSSQVRRFIASTPNQPVEGSARKQGLRVPSALRAPAPPHLAR